MKVYLVGGAVRDSLLGLSIKERDWVVVGATPRDLLQQGFIQVGRDFPVFLHPHTKEEYALARIEKKRAPGYYGFECDFGKEVSLEEDLARRDLTINAIAMDENQKIIDPYQGLLDLQHKRLRHVSPAFVEDPVRVLRVARFAARFHHLGFRLVNETRQLMYSMVKRGELAHLVPERVWQEWQKSLEEKNPEQFIVSLRASDALRVVLPELNALFGVPNPRVHHLEVDSGIHTLMTLEAICALSPSPKVRFAALLHDLGKGASPMESWPKHSGHEHRGLEIIETLCQRLRIPNAYRRLAKLVCRFHLTLHRLNELRASTVVQLLEQINAFRDPDILSHLLLASEADARSCGKPIEDYQTSRQWQYLLQECAKVSSQQMIQLGFEGAHIKEALHQHRVACVESILNTWRSNEK